jgi:HTH-type transcriptional regulator/antitoxin HigA
MKVITKNTFLPDWTVPPGSMLEEKIAEMGLTVETMAQRIELTPMEARRLLEGEIVLTDELADKLENLTGIPHEVWNNWEQTYRDDLIRLSSQE